MKINIIVVMRRRVLKVIHSVIIVNMSVVCARMCGLNAGLMFRPLFGDSFSSPGVLILAMRTCRETAECYRFFPSAIFQYTNSTLAFVYVVLP